MQEVFNRYITHLQAERNVSPYTIRNYKADLLDFFRFLNEKKVATLDEVNRQVLRDYLGHLVGRGIVKGSIARKLSAIRSFYRYLMREKLITANPVERISSPKLDKRLPSFLTLNEVKQLLEAPDPSTPQGLRDRALLELLYASGLRVSELTSLELGQINLDSNEIRVWGKGSKERVVLMGEPAAEALRNYFEQGRPKLLTDKRNNAIFLTRYGQRLPARSVQKILEHYTAKAGLKKRVHPHTLRHTFATHMLDGGADLRVVQELLGHEQLSSTQIYTHVTKKQARKVYLAAHPLAKEKGDETEDKG
ncbi:MAG: tyrosine recombinase XerC [Dehalococcoidales bacterium]|nr:tyrosine recombinase XerC [Dehalococcoidales bacterium]